MNIVIAPDSFKGSLSAKAAAQAIERGVRRALPHSETRLIPMADGGEGTLACVLDANGGRYLEVPVQDPLGRKVQARFGVWGDGTSGMVELAQAAGLYLLKEEERDPLRTSTYGFGELIRAALDAGCRELTVALGGSATNDGGAGMLQALGYALLDGEGRPVGRGGGALDRLALIQTAGADPRLAACRFILACDVDNPLIGEAGASAVFGPQKGASPEAAALLDRRLANFADVLERTSGAAVHATPGAGAAGGTAAALLALLGARLEPGFSIVARLTGLEAAIRTADLVITGEGRVDAQTAHGKTPSGVAKVAGQYGVPVLALAGSVGGGLDRLYDQGMTAALSIAAGPLTLAEAMERTAPLLEQAAEQAVRIFAAGRQSGSRRK